MRELSVIARDRVGLLADMCEKLGENGVNIGMITAETAKGTAIVRLNVDHWDKARQVLSEAAFQVVEQNLLVLRLQDQPGELARVTRKLAEEKVNIRNVRVLAKEGGETLLGVEVSNHELAKQLLHNGALRKP